MPKKKQVTTRVEIVEAPFVAWNTAQFPKSTDVELQAREAAAEVEPLHAEAATLEVVDADSHKAGIDLTFRIKEAGKKIEALRKLKGEPFRLVWAGINAIFRRPLQMLEDDEALTKGRCETYFLEQRRKAREEEERQRAEERRIQAEFDERQARLGDLNPVGSPEPAPAPARVIPRHIPEPAAPTTRGAQASGTMRVKHKAKLVNLDAVDRDYLMVDWKAVQAKVEQLERNLGSVPADAIPGFEVYEDASMAVGKR